MDVYFHSLNSKNTTQPAEFCTSATDIWQSNVRILHQKTMPPHTAVWCSRQEIHQYMCIFTILECIKEST